MKVAIFIQLFVVFSLYELALTAAEVAAYRDKQQECIKELKISAAEATQIAADKEVASPSEAYKCFHNCLYKKMGLMAADGKANSDSIVKFAQVRFKNASVDKIKAALGSCSTSVPKTNSPCDIVYNLEQCISKGLRA